jgi:hypothetical protein
MMIIKKNKFLSKITNAKFANCSLLFAHCSLRFALCSLLFALCAVPAHAAVVQRGTTNTARPSVVRENVAARLPTVTTTTAATTISATPDTMDAAPVIAPEPIIENKSSQFDATLGESLATTTDTSTDDRAEMIRRQRAALDAADATATAAARSAAAIANNSSSCDGGLRACMKQTCGADFSKCAGDGDTIWGDKMEQCRRDLNCTGEEYQKFSIEIKADRDLAADLADYQNVLDCGDRYNACIVAACGATFDNCLGKAAGDKAISECASIANECKTADSGFASRIGQVFGTLRQRAEVQVQKDEQRLYALRDAMKQQCTALGAMFDERTLDCVYTVSFFAGDDNTLFASKKLYAGDTFMCTPNWFGVDVTTYRENAYRLTRSQTAASSAMLGSGVGTAAGAIASGAIDRAVDRAQATRAASKAEKEHEQNFGDDKEDKNQDKKEEDKKEEKKVEKPTNNPEQPKTGDGTTPPTGESGTPPSTEQQTTEESGGKVQEQTEPVDKKKMNNIIPTTGELVTAAVATTQLPDECNETKRWYTLYSKRGAIEENKDYRGKYIHQPETREKYKRYTDEFDRICIQNGGTIKITEKTYTDEKNVCGTYNKYDEYKCDLSEHLDKINVAKGACEQFYKNRLFSAENVTQEYDDDTIDKGTGCKLYNKLD